ncbi:MAG: tyrosine-type recombinase/integrase [Clostridium sp.]|uniref:tyrosine-type recombinase/integrase n=1 Tax=Clostridium sp. TaxID=1506 RepID=UPI002A81CE5F|nr:tyrosine-type recombinase/integrase [Clostridium sp.]MCI6692686.1 tyrosine-type recombinase/integrase [Clostridium sp.]MDY4253803.1 tyrosine-type recombinase/integrase [Clostridium sp.]
MDYNITYRQKDNGIQVIISYKDSSGKWKQKAKQGFPNTREGNKKAKIAADLMLQELKNKVTFNANSELNAITFKEFTDIYMKHITIHLEAKTIKSYNISLRNFESLNTIEISKIKSIHIQSCVDEMIKRGVRTSSIKTYLSKIKVIFKAAVEQYNLLSITPVKNIKLENDKRKNEKKVLSNHEVEHLLSDMLNNFRNKHYYIITLLASKCGLRIGEILGLRWINIDYENKFLNIEYQWKINKDGIYTFGVPKSSNSIRKVPLPKIVLNELIKYDKENPRNIDNRILPYKNTTSLSVNLVRKYREFGYDITLHELRHTYTTNLISNGIDFKTAAKILGHDVEMTMNIYSHVTDNMLKKASTIIDNIS